MDGLILYRMLLKIHRDMLPRPLRLSGDMYIRDEFRSHFRSATPKQFELFIYKLLHY